MMPARRDRGDRAAFGAVTRECEEKLAGCRGLRETGDMEGAEQLNAEGDDIRRKVSEQIKRDKA